MTLIDELKVMNYSIIDCLKVKGISIKKNDLIKEILKDEACFFKMKKEEAFVVLKNLRVSNDMLEETYKELTNKKEFYRLYNEGIINENDKDLKIKYDMYNSNLFKSEIQNIKKEEVALVEVKEEKWYKKLFAFFKKLFKK
ncbi:MAG: hypothetical protein ACI4VP_06610 [Clostridia bacterium]|nr:hypothetical protein [Clostridia bacterium]